MNRLSYLFLPLTAIGVSACSSNKAKEEVKRPNIIFMMTDDQYYAGYVMLRWTPLANSQYGSDCQ